MRSPSELGFCRAPCSLLILVRRKAWVSRQPSPGSRLWPSSRVEEGQLESDSPALMHLGWEMWLSVFSKTDPQCALVPAEARDGASCSVLLCCSGAHCGLLCLLGPPILRSWWQTSPPTPPSESWWISPLGLYSCFHLPGIKALQTHYLSSEKSFSGVMTVKWFLGAQTRCKDRASWGSVSVFFYLQGLLLKLNLRQKVSI